MDEINLDILKSRSKDWLENTLVSRTFPPSFSHDLRKKHGGIKPPELMYELIYAYGKDCKFVIDPFVGVGSTLIASSLLGKKSLGIELNPEWREIYYQVCDKNDLEKQNWIIGDSQVILKTLNPNTFDFLITDVPYFSMDKLRQTRGKFSRAGEKSREKLNSSLKLFNEKPIPTIEEWRILIKNVFRDSYNILMKGSYLIIFIGNMYRNFKIESGTQKKSVGKYLLLSNEVADIMKKIGYYQKNELIWMDTGKKLGIYGYPYTWIPSLVDQRILIFRK